MSSHIDEGLRPLVDALCARYPRVGVIEARLTVWDDGFRQQNIRYRAPLAVLRRYGLITDEMLLRRDPRSGSGITALGEAFHLSEYHDAASASGCWELDICTESVPRQRRPIRIREAQSLLARIFTRGPAAGSPHRPATK